MYNGLGPGAYSLPPEFIMQHPHPASTGAPYSMTGPPLPMPRQEDMHAGPPGGPQSLPPHTQHIPFPHR